MSTGLQAQQSSEPASRARCSRFVVFCVTVLSASFLAWSADRTLAPVLTRPTAAPSSFSLEVCPPAEKNPAAVDSQVRIEVIYADGRRVRPQEITMGGRWTAEQNRLFHTEDARPAYLVVYGSRVVFHFLRSRHCGKVRLARDGKDPIVVDLHDLEQRDLLIDLPGSPPSSWTMPAFLVAFLGLAWTLRPWSPARTGEAWLLFQVASAHLLVWATHCVGTTNDSPGYVALAEEFWGKGQPHYFPPGYSLLIAAVDLLPFGPMVQKLTLVQHVLSIVSVLWIFRIMREYLDSGVAFLAALFIGNSSVVLFLAQNVMSESLASFCMIGSIYFAVRFRAHGLPRSAILSPVLAGWAGLTRVTPLVGCVMGWLCLHVIPPSRQGMRRLALWSGIAAAVFSMPILWYWAKSGDPRLSTGAGFHLWNRMGVAQKKLDEDGAATKSFLRLMGGRDPTVVWWWEILPILQEKGVGYEAAADLLKRVSLEALWADPLSYVGFTFRQAWGQWHDDPALGVHPWARNETVNLSLEKSPPWAPSASGLSWSQTLLSFHRSTWPAFCWSAIAGIVLLFFTRNRTVVLAMAAVPAGYLLATAAIEYELDRFSTLVLPFHVALSAVPLVIALRGCATVARSPFAAGERAQERKE